MAIQIFTENKQLVKQDRPCYILNIKEVSARQEEMHYLHGTGAN